MKIKIFTAFSFVLLINTSIAQNCIYKHYSIKDGLPSNEVYDVLQDSRSFIWFSTDNGVSRFNGYEFKTFDQENGLPDNTIFCMYEDFKDRIWFISYSCMLSYYYNDSIYEYKFNNKISESLASKNRILKRSFYIDSLETLHFGTYDQGIFTIDKNGNLENFSSNEKNQIEIKNDQIITANNKQRKLGTLLINNENNEYKININTRYNLVWLITLKLSDDLLLFSNGEYLFTIEDEKLKKKYQFDDNIPWISKDRNANLWVSFVKGGVNCYKNLNLDTLPVNYLIGKTVTSVLVDKGNSVWMTSLDGVYYFSNINIRNIVPENQSSDKKVSVLEIGKDHEIWFAGSSANVYNLKKDKVSVYENNSNGIISTLVYNNDMKTLTFGGRHAFGSIQGNEREDNIKFKIISSGYNEHEGCYFKQIIQISDTLCWYIGRNIGRLYLNTQSLYKISYEDNNISNYRPLCIYYDCDSSLYIGCKNGLWKYKKEFEFLGKKNKLLQKRIIDIDKDKAGNFWLATKGNGVMILTNDTILQITIDNGLSSNSVTSLCVYDDIAWVGTVKGLNKIYIKNIQKNEFKIEKIFQCHGLASNFINDIISDDNKLYVATDNGLSYFNIHDLALNQDPSPVYIKHVSISERDTTLLNTYDLKYSQNTISIEYIGLNYRVCDDLIYRYRLIGIDKDWVETKNRIVRYSSLNPGSYKFEVLVTNENGVLGNKPATLDFTINPPFWQTWWFYSLSAFIVLLIVFLIFFRIYRIKLKEINKRNQLYESLTRLKQEALVQQMNPHFIFNTLSSIQYYINENDKKASNKYLTMFSRLMRMTLNNSHKRNITIEEEIETLELYIELEKLRFDDKFDYTFSINKNLDTSKYVMPSLLLQPFVENSIWHGLMHKEEKGGCLKIELTKMENSILCIIKDNGIGRKKSAEINADRNKTHESLGSKITESRLKLMNSLYGDDLVIDYTDLTDNLGNACGTQVNINLPIIKQNITSRV